MEEGAKASSDHDEEVPYPYIYDVAPFNQEHWLIAPKTSVKGLICYDYIEEKNFEVEEGAKASSEDYAAKTHPTDTAPCNQEHWFQSQDINIVDKESSPQPIAGSPNMPTDPYFKQCHEWQPTNLLENFDTTEPSLIVQYQLRTHMV